MLLSNKYSYIISVHKQKTFLKIYIVTKLCFQCTFELIILFEIEQNSCKYFTNNIKILNSNYVFIC